MTAVARRPDAITRSDPGLCVVEGDVLTPSVRDPVSGADALLSALGTRELRQPATVYSEGTSTVLAAMREAGVRRFIGRYRTAIEGI